MKKLLIILFMPLISMAQLQQTYVPDDNFENVLELMGIGNGIPNDNYVTTSNIDNVTDLDIMGQNIHDLTGIEDFVSLYSLLVAGNPIGELDLSYNVNLVYFVIGDNALKYLNIANGNNYNFQDCSITGVPNLKCVQMDTSHTIGGTNFIHIIMYRDTHLYASDDCSSLFPSTSILEVNPYRKLVRVIDLFGRDVIQYNQAVFLIYDDGSVERRVIIQ